MIKSPDRVRALTMIRNFENIENNLKSSSDLDNNYSVSIAWSQTI